MGRVSRSKPSRRYRWGPANYARNGCRTPGKIPKVIYHTKRARPGNGRLKRPDLLPRRPILLLADELCCGENSSSSAKLRCQTSARHTRVSSFCARNLCSRRASVPGGPPGPAPRKPRAPQRERRPLRWRLASGGASAPAISTLQRFLLPYLLARMDYEASVSLKRACP